MSARGGQGLELRVSEGPDTVAAELTKVRLENRSCGDLFVTYGRTCNACGLDIEYEKKKKVHLQLVRSAVCRS